MIDPKDILFEDASLIIIYKREYEVVEAHAMNLPSLEDKIALYLKQRDGNCSFLRACHRLDKPVKGLVIFAKSEETLSRISKMFIDRQIEKYYIAVTKNRPKMDERTLDHYLKHDTKINKAIIATPRQSSAKKATLKYKYLCSNESYHFLLVELMTGRSHQIRAQLAAIGCPIKGDLKYGFQRSNKEGGIDLLAYYLKFKHPFTNQEIKIKASLEDSNFYENVKKYLEENPLV